MQKAQGMAQVFSEQIERMDCQIEMLDPVTRRRSGARRLREFPAFHGSHAWSLAIRTLAGYHHHDLRHRRPRALAASTLLDRTAAAQRQMSTPRVGASPPGAASECENRDFQLTAGAVGFTMNRKCPLLVLLGLLQL